MKRFAADLHIHTALSPCALEEMTPAAIVAAAAREGLGMIAICDHNAAGNVEAAQAAAAARGGVSVLAGIEITTAEEAHVLGLFSGAPAASAVAGAVRATLPPAGPQGVFGGQFLMDASGAVVGSDDRHLAMASGFDLEDAAALIRRHGGLVVASHVDRPSYSVISQLGLFPTTVTFDAIEVSAAGVRMGRDAEFRALGLPMLTASDSHFLSDIGTARTWLDLRDATFDELRLALRAQDGRRCSLA